MNPRLLLVLIVVAVIALVVLRPWNRADPGTTGADPGPKSTQRPGPPLEPANPSNRAAQGNSGTPPGSPAAGQPAPGKFPPGTVKKRPDPPAEPFALESMIALSRQLNQPEQTVDEDLGVIAELIRSFIRFVGTAPEGGLNVEIVRSLRGDNPMKMIFIPNDHPGLNAEGELLDRFGTPYYFHPVSKDTIEIRSAGPDKALWSDDDILYE